MIIIKYMKKYKLHKGEFGFYIELDDNGKTLDELYDTYMSITLCIVQQRQLEIILEKTNQ